MKEHVKIIQKNVNNGSGAVYGLGLIGALVYFLSHASTFWEGIIAILKSLVWPALLVNSLLNYLKL